MGLGRSTSLKTRASEVQHSIVDVRLMSEELLNKNVDTIKQINISQFLPVFNEDRLTRTYRTEGTDKT